MKAQSLSIVVPNQGCVNNCRFCVSHMSEHPFENQIDDNLPFFDLYLKDYLKRLEFAQQSGCNTVMLTGNTEPQQNRKFLTYFGLFLQLMRNPFSWIEMQTTGVLLDQNYLRFLRNHVGVSLISLSISSFYDEVNADIIRIPENLRFSIKDLCREIRRYDFSLRLSLNLSDAFEGFSPEALFEECRLLGADQVTLRVLYSDGDSTEQARWVKQHKVSVSYIEELADFIRTNGGLLGRLPYGAEKYFVNGMSIVLDNDCMGKHVSNVDNERLQEQDTYKYLILQPDCKLYSQWDNPASLIF